ncbi:MAG: hypothetical protein RML46_01115 [Anaerolineae bacterium]|nr:hypothetical protein [Anaerolineae bacterium]MDW8067494.1 hypothetical protein [Anaerolineae bacterium]
MTKERERLAGIRQACGLPYQEQRNACRESEFVDKLDKVLQSPILWHPAALEGRPGISGSAATELPLRFLGQEVLQNGSSTLVSIAF